MNLQQRFQSGILHHQAGRLIEAENVYREVLAQEPNHADALHLLGVVVGQMGRLDESVELIRRAIVMLPNNAAYYGSLGNALQDQRQLDDAIGAFRNAIRLRPDFAEAYNNLGNVLRDTRQLDEAIASFREAIRLRPDKAAAHSNLLAALYYDPRQDAGTILDEHRRWDELHAEPLRKAIQPHANDRDPGRRLRVGYVSADFCRHPVGLFMVPLLKHHDRRNVEVFCYSDVRTGDEITAKLRESAHVWRDIAGMADAPLAQGIRTDQIDILVDLSLHSAGNRLLVFARKPAPVQVTWLGYAGTTGLTSMDYRLTDPILDPPGTDQFYSEKSVRLPHTFWCYEPMDQTLQVGTLPAIENGYVTFGSFNNFAKVTSGAIELWARILAGIARSHLMIHCPPGEARARTISRFVRAGVGAGRVEFVDRKPLRDYLLQFNRVDIALDPFPCGGGTSTCDALWMGVPTVTLRGHTAVGRGSASILSNVGLANWIADTPEQYMSIATERAGDLAHLAELRTGLRKKIERSPLMDAARFAFDMEAAYRGKWENWCSEQR
ncbi:MAG TPA: tetratricopeptide repeat protein [Tepidisphaeraceae bacterium]|jgi:predicted O-linked N-acetylglucosamine transferase (SPINDLY family)